MRVEFVGIGHGDADGGEGMEDPDGVAVFGEDFIQAFVAVRRFVETGAAEFDSGAIDPFGHHLL